MAAKSTGNTQVEEVGRICSYQDALYNKKCIMCNVDYGLATDKTLNYCRRCGKKLTEVMNPNHKQYKGY